MNFKKILIAFIIVIALGAGVAIYYYYFVLNKIPQTPPVTTNTQQPVTEDIPQSSLPTSSQTATPNPTPASEKPTIGRTDTSSPLPSIAPNFSCKVDSDCGIDPATCKAVNKSSAPQNSGNSSCQGTVKCMYGACALIK